MNQPVTDHASAVATILASIEFVAPDVDGATVPTDADMRIEAELDSMDFMAVLAAIKDRTGVEVPDADIAQVTTIDGCATYLVTHLADTTSAAGSRADRP